MPSETIQINVNSIYLLIAAIAFVTPAFFFLWRAGRAWERIGGQIATVAIAQDTAAASHQTELVGVNKRLDTLNGSTAANRSDTQGALERIAGLEGREVSLSHSHAPLTAATPPTPT